MARLGPGLLRMYAHPEERRDGVYSVGVMGSAAVVTDRVGALLAGRDWADVERLLLELQRAGALCWRCGEPEGIAMSGAA